MSPLQHVARSVVLRIVASLAAALIVVFSLVAVYLGRSVRDDNLRELRERSQLLADTLAHGAELPLLARDAPTLEALLAGSARESDLVEAALFDGSGRELARFAPPTSSRASLLALESTVTTLAGEPAGSESPAFALDVDTRTNRQEIGRVRLLVSTARTAARTRSLQLQIAGAGAGLLLLCVALGLAAARLLGGPLRELVAATRRVAEGDLAVRVRPRSSDELGELAEAFNRMAADLERAQRIVQADRSELERRVVERTAELERAHESLVQSEKMSAVGKLVAGVAHELNNPLTVVLGYAGLMLERNPDPALRSKLESIHAAADGCRSIVQNLLAFARQQKPAKHPIDINDAICRTVELRAYHLRSAQIEVQYALDPEPPLALADRHQLQQVVLNLLVNAEQAMADARRGSRIQITTRRIGEWIETAIEDDGPGMPPDVRARVFEPFFTTKDVGRGTGLGLSICYGIIAEHGGSIAVQSEPGRFTRFIIILPMARAEALAAAEPAPPPAAFPTPGLHLLVIDDDPDIVRFVEEAFAGEPVTIECAHGGRAGIDRLATGRTFDVVLSDLRMPEIDGRAVHRFVRERRPELTGRLIFATGDVANPDSVSFVQASGCTVLEKPFSLAALRQAVERVARG